MSDDIDYLRILLDSSEDNIYFKDRAGKFLMANAAMARYFKLPDAASVVGKSDFDFFSEEHARQAYDDEQTIISTGRPFLGVVEKETWPDGAITWVSTSKMPLRNASGDIVGVFGISRDITEQRTAQERVAHYAEILREKNTQMQADLSMAGDIQRAFLSEHYPVFPPDAAPERSQLQFVHYYRTTGLVGGDFFTIVPLGPQTAGLFVCDVMGHGVQAALVAAMVRAFLSDLAFRIRDPGELLGVMNAKMREIVGQTSSSIFATAVYVVVDCSTGDAVYASAGHPASLLLRPSARDLEILGDDRPRPALGLMGNTLYASNRMRMGRGDMIFMYTDGLTEVMDPENRSYSEEMLADALRRRVAQAPADISAGVLGEIQQFARGMEYPDDICLLIARYQP
jgi:phosphoserine phosphatase RsbU/P